MNWAEFFNMGGYAFYVWFAWGLTVLVLTLNIVLPYFKKNSIKKSIKRQHNRERMKNREQTKNRERIKNSKQKK